MGNGDGGKGLSGTMMHNITTSDSKQENNRGGVQMDREVTYTFKVKIEKIDDEEQGRRYEAYCDRLSGCRVHAGSEKEALSKFKKAIDLWIDFADKLVGEDVGEIEERIDSLLSD